MRFHYGKPPRVWWWIKYLVAGKYGLLGPYHTEGEARNNAEKELMDASSWEPIPLNTKDKNAASAKLKALVLHETGSLAQAMQRMRRKAPSENKQQGNTEIHFI